MGIYEVPKPFGIPKKTEWNGVPKTASRRKCGIGWSFRFTPTYFVKVGALFFRIEKLNKMIFFAGKRFRILTTVPWRPPCTAPAWQTAGPRRPGDRARREGWRTGQLFWDQRYKSEILIAEKYANSVRTLGYNVNKLFKGVASIYPWGGGSVYLYSFIC